MPDFGLKFFILQQRVIHLYRYAIRASRRARLYFPEGFTTAHHHLQIYLTPKQGRRQLLGFAAKSSVTDGWQTWWVSLVLHISCLCIHRLGCHRGKNNYGSPRDSPNTSNITGLINGIATRMALWWRGYWCWHLAARSSSWMRKSDLC